MIGPHRIDPLPGQSSGTSSQGKAGLVDRYRVVVFPVITGSTGRELIYDSYPDVALDMLPAGRRRPNPIARVVPTVLAGPPG
jgi:hypothetical protein